MSTSLPKKEKLVPISEAAQVLGVSIDTVRHWDKAGVLHSKRPDGKNRYFSLKELEKVKFSKPLSISEAAESLGKSQSTLRRLEKKGLIEPQRNSAGERIYTQESLKKFLQSEYFLTHDQIEKKILGVVRKDISREVAGIALLGVTAFILLTATFTLSFLLNPAQTAQFFGFSAETNEQNVVLGAKYDSKNKSPETTILGRMLKPIGELSLQIVKLVDDSTFRQIVPAKKVESEKVNETPQTLSETITQIIGIEEVKSASSKLKVSTVNNISTLDLDLTGITADISKDSVKTEHIKDGTITGDDINSNFAGAGLTLSSQDPDVLNIGAGTGITVGANDIAVNTAASLTWSSAQTFDGNVGIGSSLTVTSGAIFSSFVNATSFQGAGLTDCNNGITSKLLWDATTNKFSCGIDQIGEVTPTVKSINDTTTENLTATDSIILDGGPLSISPSASTNEILVMVTVRVNSDSNDKEVDAFEVRRSIDGTDPTCLSTLVGSVFQVETTQPDDDWYTATNYVDSPATTSEVKYTVCGKVLSGTASNDTDQITLVLMEVNIGADLAEAYNTNDSTLGPGEVVTLDPTLLAGVKRSNVPYDRNAIGVVSKRPSMVIGGGDRLGVSAVPIALSGRVPVKVSSENGYIKQGDFLTSSSTPGVAMRATKAGPIVGIAMSDFDGSGIGIVMMFINKGYFNGISFANLLPDPNNPIKLEVLDESIKILTKSNTIFQALVEFIGNVIFRGDISFEGRPIFNKDTAGFAQIKKDADFVEVVFEKEYAALPLVNASITLDNMDDEASQSAIEKQILESEIHYIITRRTTKGFVIKLSKEAPVDLKFSWSALAVKDAKTFGSKLSSITQEATSSAIIKPKTIKINDNQLGYLRVREEATTFSAEVGQVEPGQEFEVLSERNGWYMIEHKVDFYGWVSGQYAEVL